MLTCGRRSFKLSVAADLWESEVAKGGRRMSDDPYLYNDQLPSTRAPVQWDDVPVMLQKDIFEHLGCLRKLGYRRLLGSVNRLSYCNIISSRND